jgi:hypothetical protein
MKFRFQFSLARAAATSLLVSLLAGSVRGAQTTNALTLNVCLRERLSANQGTNQTERTVHERKRDSP